MIVSTNVRFLEDDYVMDNKPRSKVVLYELKGEGVVSSVPETLVEPPWVASTQEQREPCRSWSVVRQPDHFIGMGESIDKS